MKTFFKLLPLLALPILLFSFQGEGVEAGDAAPAFNLKNIDGEMVSLDSYKDKEGVIVIFTCNHCPYAKMYEDRIIAIDKKYASQNWPVVAINPNDPISYPEDSYKNMKKRAKKKGFTFPYLFDETQEIATAYGALKTPHVYLLKSTDAGFKVVYTGAIDDNPRDAASVEEKYLENAIEATKSGDAVSPVKTKAIGCGIKWKKS